MTEMTLDFDDENLRLFEPALEKVYAEYGDKVRVRKSSRRGWHIWVVGVEFEPDEELRLRKILGDCVGRLEGDWSRLLAGMRTSRLFTVKARKYGEIKDVYVAGQWMTYDEWREKYGKTESTKEKEEE